MEDHSLSTGNLRGASSGDIAALSEVCRKSFSASLRWQASAEVAGRWWRAVLATSAAETRVFESDGAVSGFCVLVRDLDLWARQAGQRKTPMISAIWSALRHPTIAITKIRKRFAVQRASHQDASGSSTSNWPRAGTWIELIAVDPALRSRGVARTLLAWCEARTSEVGGAVIGLSVDGDNHSAIRLYEAAGYVSAPAVGSRRVYLKNLAGPSGPNAGMSENMKDALPNYGDRT